MKLVVDSGGVITTETRNAVRTVPLIDRVANSQVSSDFTYLLLTVPMTEYGQMSSSTSKF